MLATHPVITLPYAAPIISRQLARFEIRAAILPVTHSQVAPVVCRVIFCRSHTENLGLQFYGACEGCDIFTTSYIDQKSYSMKQKSYIWC